MAVDTQNKMIIAVFKNDANRHPYLVHDVLKSTAILGLKSFPDTEQANEIDLSEIEILDNNSIEYKQAEIIINDFLNSQLKS